MRLDLPRLRRLLGGAELAGLRARLRERFQRDAGRGEFLLPRLNAAERQALEGLLGRAARRADSMRLSHAELDAALARSGAAGGLREALEALDGPIGNPLAQRRAEEQSWQAVFDAVTEPRLRSLFTDHHGRGRLKRLAGSSPAQAARLLAQAAGVLARLPAAGLPLAQLAAETLGDAHGLDAGAAPATLVLNAAAPLVDGAEDSEASRARNRWAQLGVAVQELARPVLLLNLSAADDGPAAALARRAAASGEPLHLSLRALLRAPPRWDVAGRAVHVCENATVLALAADRLGVRAAPLVCTDGMPAAAQRTLLAQLATAGARLLYHGDFDWPGLRIGNFVMRQFGARPWRFGAADYRPRPGRALEGDPTAADWDPALAPKMAQAGCALDEESVLDSLLDELACPPA